MKKSVFVSDSEPYIISSLEKFGYGAVAAVPNPMLAEPVRTHADCSLFTPDGNTFFIEQGNYKNIVKYFTKGESDGKRKEGKRFISVSDIKFPYPDDVKLNCKSFGKKILCNSNTVCAEIKKFADDNGYELMHCNQGYAACSTVKINDYAAITDDESIYDTLISNGIDCIKLSKGSVKLKGFDYGFIGGCCGVTDRNRIIFTGNINKHKDAELIKDFLIKYNIESVSLSDGDLIDIGGIIALD